ncbi:putative immunogenic protein [Daldinia childiae]|uniref:putative immunogenic protein n=1 Tax=Daldinia childiae TaxID=326645 RepID=UPI0014465844|nr:putative immunogenic protein [Daldinia childiae]KAF3057418.1 putative immunogenic protein [Daldinia childiae]
MAEEQKPVEVAETTPVVVEPVAETKPVEDKPVETAPVAEAATEAPAEATETTEAAAPTEEAKKEEVKPVEAGTLEHKGAPANFPKNLIYSKQHFWFGTDAIPKEKLATYLKNEKATDVAHHVTAWAAETGKGLFFYGKESDKSTPTGAIQLAEASEPAVEGATKFSFTAKGHKHAFKAPTAADRDNWVEQLKLKIAEAKELAATIAETEAYKQTIESLKPTKEEKPAEAEPAKEEAKEEPKEEDKKEEPKEEEAKKEDGKDSKRRSASRKRASIFGNLLGKKEEAKKETPAEDKTAEDKPAETTEAAEPVPEVAAVATETPAVETPAAEETKKEEPVKPTPTKRASLFGGLSFGKKKVESESAPATPAKDAPVDASVAETAPVIPAVETSEPLSTEVASPATVPTETTDITPATNGETKEKTEKRKSSLPFGFGKKEKAATSDEEGEKVKSPPFFSKLRQTVKGKGKAEKPADESKAEDAKPADVAEETEPAKEAEAEPAVAPIAEETAEKPAAATPAPVTAAA